VGTIVLLKIVDLLTGIRVPEEHEIEGLTLRNTAKRLITLSRRKKLARERQQGRSGNTHDEIEASFSPRGSNR